MKALIVILLLIPLLASSQSYLTTSLSKKSVSIDLGVKHSTWGFAIGMNAFSRSYSTVKGFGHFLDISPIFTPAIIKKGYSICFPTGYNWFGAEIRTRYGLLGWNNWNGLKVGYSVLFSITK